jgi:hypothetical protein
MTTLMPQGDAIKKAVQWISEQRLEHPDAPVHQWVSQAGLRFNLSPKDEAFLLRFCKEKS